jgi:hypothetical protein
VQQALVVAAAARRAERGVLGACGEIVARGPLQLPWCLYWSDDAGTAAAGGMYPACNFTADSTAPDTVKHLQNQSVATLSPGTLTELHERVQGLCAAVESTQHLENSRFHGYTAPAVPIHQQSSRSETIRKEQHAVEAKLVQELSLPEQHQDTHEAMASLKRTCEVLEGDSWKVQAGVGVADARQVQVDWGASLLLFA